MCTIKRLQGRERSERPWRLKDEVTEQIYSKHLSVYFLLNKQRNILYTQQCFHTPLY